ncbi:MAG: TrpB-like pyridoxal phosphate-dependent enzyme [Deltaproteobacteria bacterium]|uniref:Tryptophan synthase beta chain n=1 Tax=Candidatus Zymogenus saltonus TaxID=2844893 RepID=A0A9D8KD35_9DELT|nr:TrpB-like pyridoxal phosphate-dependent enzyme [Candidatus Zymogenus saltonus]
MKDRKVILSKAEMPKKWYNIVADMPVPMKPTISPRTLKPATPDDFIPIFPMGIIEQEVSEKEFIDIPEEVMEALSIWRPTPLVRALNLEKYLDTPAKIYYKNESVSPPGSHKPNTAVAQAYYNKKEGIKKISTETGAGQWGSALSFAGALFGIDIVVYMVKISFEQKPYRKSMIETWGGTIYSSPTDRTESGRAIRKQHPNTNGTLGIAISEAVEHAATSDDTNYSIGSVLNHVCMHQTVVGEEALLQMKKTGDYPDVVIGCIGGGSNFAGLSYPFMREKIRDGKKTRIVGVEPFSCPTLTKGLYAFDYGDTAMVAPILFMHTLGHTFEPPGIHAGGLRYHGMAPTMCLLYDQKLMDAVAYHQNACFEAAVTFARTEGIIPAPETSHAIRAAIDEALEAKKEGKERVILFNFSGHGHFDMAAYDKYFSKDLEDYEYPSEKIEAALKDLPKIEL